MQRHESYKPSGVKWLGDVPSHWNVQTLRAVTQLKSDRNRPDLPVLSVYREYGVIRKDSRDDNHNATSLDTSTYKVVQPGDLVVNKMKAWQGSMGISAYEGIVSPAYITCSTKSERVLPGYLHYLLRSSSLIGVYNSLSYGVRVGQWDMHYEDFKQIAIPLPSTEEQSRIVAFLDRKTSETDASIAKKERLIQLLEESKRSLINQAVTGGLSGNAPLVPTGLSWFPVAPAHWKLKRLKTISSFITSGPRGWSERLSDEGAVFLQSGNLNDSFGIDMESAHRVVVPKGAEARRTRLHDDDVLICITGANTGRIAVANTGMQEAYINQHLSLARLKEANPKFVAYSLSAQGSTYFMLCQYGLKEGLSLFDVANAPILLPSLDEQNEIVAFLDQGVVKIDMAMAASIKQCQQLEELKRTMIAEAVIGRQVQ